MRLIDADLFKKGLQERVNRYSDYKWAYDMGVYQTYMNVISFLDEHPTIEPEIIRCKNCKYMTEYYDVDRNEPYWICSEWCSETDYDGFCHYAERRN